MIKVKSAGNLKSEPPEPKTARLCVPYLPQKAHMQLLGASTRAFSILSLQNMNDWSGSEPGVNLHTVGT